MCEKLGYRLIHIWEVDWLKDRKNILHKIVNIIESKSVNYDKLILNNKLILDRCWFPKRDIEGYKFIKETRLKIINKNTKFPYWNCGSLIYEKIKE